MGVQQLVKGSRNLLKTKTDSMQKINVGIRLSSQIIDIGAIVDIAVVCKSRTKGIYTIWYGNSHDDEQAICDQTINCNGSVWNDDDLRVTIDFSKIDRDIEKMSVVTNILWSKNFDVHYGMLEKGYMHIYGSKESPDILQQHINWKEYEGKTGMIWIEIYQYKDDWKIRAIEEAVVSKDLGQLVQIASSYL